MDVLLGAALGLALGWGATRLHPAVNGGAIAAVVSALLGGLAGQAWLGERLAPMLADSALAGAAAGGAIGGLVLAPAVGVAVRQWQRRRASAGGH